MDMQYVSVCTDMQCVDMDAFDGHMQTGLTDFYLMSTGCSLSWTLVRQRLTEPALQKEGSSAITARVGSWEPPGVELWPLCTRN